MTVQAVRLVVGLSNQKVCRFQCLKTKRAGKVPAMELHILGQHTAALLYLLMTKLARRANPLFFSWTSLLQCSKWRSILCRSHAHPQVIRIFEKLLLFTPWHWTVKYQLVELSACFRVGWFYHIYLLTL